MMKVSIPQTTPLEPRRGRLALVTKGVLTSPLRGFMYGPEGVGKSSFFAEYPGLVFIGAEGGTERLDVERLPDADDWDQFMADIEELTTAPHAYRAVCIDPLGWVEALIWRHLCAKAKVTTIEDVGGGYGKGYNAALDEWRKLLAALGRMRDARKMAVFFTGHSHTKNYKNPEGDDYDRIIPAMHAGASELVKQWCDFVLYATHETFTADKTGSTAKNPKKFGVGGARVMFTERRPAFDAKNRFHLPPKMPLDWASFHTAVSGAPPSISLETIEELAAGLSDADRAHVPALIQRANGDDGKLVQLAEWIKGRIASQ